MNTKITKDTTLAEILKNPELVKILVKYNLPCLSCPFAKMEIENLKIGQVCQMYNLPLKKIIADLNK